MPTFLQHKIPPPVLGVLVALGMLYLAKAGESLNWPMGVRWLGALGFFVVGLAIELTAIISFRKAKTTINPLTPNDSSQLVAHGIYRLSRNPMYVGMVCQLLAMSWYLAAPITLLGLPVFIWLINECQIKPEEAALKERFGEHFHQYQARVRRWL
ncbi:isoprenylcysteine carboxylmethyltransferase family protein [Halioxenophilus aromaticivorans]|uniref:methyltransferase family protein n=1 Tax=Halioxenophilus aromaticivorans TaxID=1306992 RepID=UPI0031E96F71